MNLSSASLPVHQKRTGKEHFGELLSYKYNLVTVRLFLLFLAYATGYISVHNLLSHLKISDADLNLVSWDYLDYFFKCVHSSFFSLYIIICFIFLMNLLPTKVINFMEECFSIFICKNNPPNLYFDKKERISLKDYELSRINADFGGIKEKFFSLGQLFIYKFIKFINFIPRLIILIIFFFFLFKYLYNNAKLIPIFWLTFLTSFSTLLLIHSLYTKTRLGFFLFSLLLAVSLYVYLFSDAFNFFRNDLTKLNQNENSIVTLSDSTSVNSMKILSFDQFYLCLLKNNGYMILPKDKVLSIHHPPKVEASP